MNKSSFANEVERQLEEFLRETSFLDTVRPVEDKTVLSLYISVKRKKDFDLIQERSKKQFGKLLVKMFEYAIEQVMASDEMNDAEDIAA